MLKRIWNDYERRLTKPEILRALDTRIFRSERRIIQVVDIERESDGRASVFRGYALESIEIDNDGKVIFRSNPYGIDNILDPWLSASRRIRWMLDDMIEKGLVEPKIKRDMKPEELRFIQKEIPNPMSSAESTIDDEVKQITASYANDSQLKFYRLTLRGESQRTRLKVLGLFPQAVTT